MTGPSRGDGTSWDYSTIKYGPRGNQVWVKRLNSPFNGYDGSTDIAVDALDNVYATGYSYRGGGTNPDYITMRYTKGGLIAWVKRYNGTGNAGDEAWAIAIDGYGVYVTGTSMGLGSNTDYATIRYNIWGSQRWVRRYPGPVRGTVRANDVAAGNGKVYVTGYSTGRGTNGDYLTISYRQGGLHRWSDRYNGSGNGFDQSNAVGICPRTGRVFVTGGSAGRYSRSDFATIVYAP